MVKDRLTTRFIKEREERYLQYFVAQTKSLSSMVMMGNTECARLPVLSFCVTHTQPSASGADVTKYLHHNFVASLFNDLFVQNTLTTSSLR